jgi:hypothetical protein
MANRLEPINLMTFTGGLNLRRNQFELSDDESPDMLNVDIDPRGGFYTRHGWQRWNRDDIITTGAWEPRNAWVHTAASGSQSVYVVNGGTIYRSGSNAAFTVLAGPLPGADPHGADFTAWGDDVYLVSGRAQLTHRVNTSGVAVPMAWSGYSEIDTPSFDMVPKADYVTTHAGYMFVAVTNEFDGDHLNRIRWSHPGVPDAWRDDDFIDIESGGGKITGIIAFNDHLLIFKTSTMWALYGYDDESWQLVQVSTKIGCPAITALTRSEATAFFYSAADQGGIYAYQGAQPVYLSEALRPAFEEVLNFNNVFVSWAGRRLWVVLPWMRYIGSTVNPSTTFVYDPDTGRGAWTMYRCDIGSLGLVIDNSDISSKFPLATFWSTETACLVMLEYINDAYDIVTEPAVLGTENSIPDNFNAPVVVTGLNEEIGVTGVSANGIPFDSYYRTRWLHAGWPDRKKSWRRPTFVCREVPRETDLVVETYHDYNETTIHRSRILHLPTKGTAYWTPGGINEADVGGFNWTPEGLGDPTATGANWTATQAGSTIVRGASQGLARAIQMRVRASPNTPRQRWGVDGIVAKIVMRRFR